MTGNDLRQLRERLGWTQEEAAKRLGYSYRTLQRREARGSQKIPVLEAAGIRATLDKHWTRD